MKKRLNPHGCKNSTHAFLVRSISCCRLFPLESNEQRQQRWGRMRRMGRNVSDRRCGNAATPLRGGSDSDRVDHTSESRLGASERLLVCTGILSNVTLACVCNDQPEL